MRSLLACALALSACSVGAFEAPEASSASDIFAEAPRPRRSPVTLRVASYNVLYALAAEDGTVDADTLERATSLDADVLLLQETNATWEAALRPALARRYERCVFHEPQKWAPEGLALCAKGKIVEDELIPSELGGFPAQRAVAEVSGVTLQILNLHLRPAVANPAEWVDSHVKTRHERAREIRDYLPRLRADLPTILGGDMNEQPEGTSSESSRAPATTARSRREVSPPQRGCGLAPSRRCRSSSTTWPTARASSTSSARRSSTGSQ
ncbi:MAG: hypothetical protein IPM79_33650 [Polyangiaceae bacterium]|nr:hypothetical protein [Polyangiaceae bacterium]